jgi:virginiamycin B lyase
VFVDDKDGVWLTDFTSNAIVRFDPQTGKFEQGRQHVERRRRHGLPITRFDPKTEKFTFYYRPPV